jgi:hypothetical protein
MKRPTPYPRTWEYNKDGKVLYCCFNCGYCSNYGEEEERNLHFARTMELSLFSNRVRKQVCFQIINNNGFIDESERKQLIAKVNKSVRNVSDNLAVKTISEMFNMKPATVLNLFFQINRKKFRDYTVDIRIR